MNSKAKMKIVDDLFDGISTRIGTLTSHGVFTCEEGFKIIQAIADKETKWMQSNFSDTEIYEFMNNKH